MALPNSGPISLNDIQTEFGGDNPISISEYYGADTGVPGSGTISLSDFYGTSASPPVSTGGLQLWYDIGNTDSYSGSGNSLIDLSPNKSNTTLVNSPLFFADNGGYLNFDGINQYFDIAVKNLSSVATIDMWVRQNEIKLSSIFLGWYKYNINGTSQNYLVYNTYASDSYGLNKTQTTDILNNWKHLVFVMHADIPYTNNKIYVDGVERPCLYKQGTENPDNRNFNNGNGRCPGWRLSDDSPSPAAMDLSSLKIYNKELTQEEITQNYNADKDRFL